MPATKRDLATCESIIVALEAEVVRSLVDVQDRLETMAKGYQGTREAFAWRDETVQTERSVVDALESLLTRLRAARSALHRPGEPS